MTSQFIYQVLDFSNFTKWNISGHMHDLEQRSWNKNKTRKLEPKSCDSVRVQAHCIVICPQISILYSRDVHQKPSCFMVFSNLSKNTGRIPALTLLPPRSGLWQPCLYLFYSVVTTRMSTHELRNGNLLGLFHPLPQPDCSFGIIARLSHHHQTNVISFGFLFS